MDEFKNEGTTFILNGHKIINVNQERLYELMLNCLKPGDVLLTGFLSFGRRLSISPISHACVFYGLGLKTALIRMKDQLLNDGEEAKFLLDKNIYIKDELLKKLNNYNINKITDEEYYVIDLMWHSLAFKRFRSYIKYYDEIYCFRPKIEHPLTFANLYL